MSQNAQLVSDPNLPSVHMQATEVADMTRDQVARSKRRDVRNPLLSLPGVQALLALPQEQREALRTLLKDIALDARSRAEKCWRTHKAPMAVYWKAISVHAGHIAKALRLHIKRGQSGLERPSEESITRKPILVTDATWRAYERFGNGDATRGVERAAAWLDKLEEIEGWTRAQMAE